MELVFWLFLIYKAKQSFGHTQVGDNVTSEDKKAL
jgi:hypothetical protein